MNDYNTYDSSTIFSNKFNAIDDGPILFHLKLAHSLVFIQVQFYFISNFTRLTKNISIL